MLLFRQHATQARRQVTMRDAIISATSGIPQVPVPDQVAAFPITEIEHFSPIDVEKFSDDDYSSFLNDIN